MVTDNHYRWDFIQLSTDTKPTPATSPKVADGSTLYTSDDSKLYIWYKDQWYEKTATGGTTYTAGDNITITDGVISATDTTYSSFTGTDGVDVGTSGLVPAPAITDVGKFLKADGTWSTAGGGSGVVTLTAADYNWPEDVPQGFAAWKFDGGFYKFSGFGSGVRIYTNPNNAGVFKNYNKDSVFGVYKTTTKYALLAPDPDFSTMSLLTGTTTGIGFNTTILTTQSIEDSLNAQGVVTSALSANQGYVLNQKITPTTGASAPTTSTTGELGKIYIDTDTDTAYMCTKASSGVYTWKQITA